VLCAEEFAQPGYCVRVPGMTGIKPGLDGAWLGSFYVITYVIDKESYSNAPCIRPGAARLVFGGARLGGSPQKRFFLDPHWDSAWAAVAATRGLQSTRQASLVQVSIHLGLVFVSAVGVREEWNFLSHNWYWLEWSGQTRTFFKFIEQHDLFHKPSRAASCSQIVFSVPICWPSKWRHVTRRAARRLIPA
jgi:hypothetical protein